MLRIKKYLDITYHKLTKLDWDNVICIAGDEGCGKSTLGLQCLHYWLNKKNGEVKAEDARHMCLTAEAFLKDLKDAGKFECCVYDEAGELNNRRALSQFNVAMMKAYQVIRGDNILSILILPSLWELDPFFVKRRLRGLFVVYKRGRAAFWNKKRLRFMVEKNYTRPTKNYWRVRPAFYDKFYKYKGAMKPEYDRAKAEKMEKIRVELYKEFVDKKKESPLDIRDKLIAKTSKQMSVKDLSHLFGFSESHIHRIIKKHPPLSE